MKKLFLSIFILLIAVNSFAFQLTFVWDAHPAAEGIDGVRIYWGNATGSYPNMIDVATNTGGRPEACANYDPTTAECSEYTLKFFRLNQEYHVIAKTYYTVNGQITESLPTANIRINEPCTDGHMDFCRDCGPCAEGQGDCDNNSECAGDLVCPEVPGTDRCARTSQRPTINPPANFRIKTATRSGIPIEED